MFRPRKYVWLSAAHVCIAAATTSTTQAQTITAKQLSEVLPDQKFLTGFTRWQPAGETYLVDVFSREQNKWITPVSPAKYLQDNISVKPGVENALDQFQAPVPGIVRQLYTVDGTRQVTLTADVFAHEADAASAMTRFRSRCQSPFMFGRPSDPVKFDMKTYSFAGRPARSKPFGDESYYNVNKITTMLLRAGKLVVLIDGGSAYFSSKNGTTRAFPVAVVEKIAGEIVKRVNTMPTAFR